jgi:hypothetical protein
MSREPVPTIAPVSDPLSAGTPVRVRNTLGSWAAGFEVVGRDPSGYLVRRLSDGWLLPRPIGVSEVRRS